MGEKWYIIDIYIYDIIFRLILTNHKTCPILNIYAQKGRQFMNVTFLIGNGFDLNLGLKTSFSNFFGVYKTLPAITSRYAGKKATYTQEEFEEKLQRFKEDIDSNITLWSDFEKRMGEYTDSENINNDKYLFIDILRDFRMNFANYLKEQTSDFDYSNIDYIKKNLGESVYDFHKHFLPQDKKTITDVFNTYRDNSYTTSIILFNYTNILNHLINALPSSIQNNIHKHTYSSGNECSDTIKDVIHIHGTLSTNMIIGVNDKEQIVNEDFKEDAEVCRAFIKQSINEKVRDYRLSNSMEKIKNSDLICIYGMSFGETDRYIWEKVINWLLGASQRKVVIFAFEKEYSPLNPEETQEIIEEYQDKLLNHNTFNEDERNEKISALRNQIVVGINTPIFRFDLHKKEHKPALPVLSVPNVSEQLKEVTNKISDLSSPK